MKYVNREMKVDQIVGYFNQHKINLIPPFQRGSVWNLATRQRLIENMVQMRPIPAIFLYKQADGAQFAYNILDGKQRLESLILFIGDRRDGMTIEDVKSYFFGKPAAENANFHIVLHSKEVRFKGLDDELVRAFREYAIPTIEIDLDDESTSIDEIINLFIDINQQGVKVSRFDVVKALGKDPLFKQVFDLIAQEQKRKKGKSLYYKAKSSSYGFVLKRLNIVTRLVDKMSQVDRMWERLTEIALFSRVLKHRSPADILKGFIKHAELKNPKLDKAEERKLHKVFSFLVAAYRKYPLLMNSRFAKDQPQFYTMVTSLLSSELMTKVPNAELSRRIFEFSQIVDGARGTPASLIDSIKEFKDLSAKQTTHPARRARRQELFVEAIDALG